MIWVLSSYFSMQESHSHKGWVMIAEILSTGDEVCFGTVADTNAAHIAAKLWDLGIDAVRHTCVPDDMALISRALTEIGKRADISIITGGLGPTIDDITAEAAAQSAGVPLVLNQTARDYIENFFAKISRNMSGSDIKQAMLPLGAVPILNHWGTAPGFILHIGKCRCYFLPGVPKEMEHMLDEHVIPDILKIRGNDNVFHHTWMMSVFGLPESMVNERLKGISSVYPQIRLGMVARFPVIYVKMTLSGTDKDAIFSMGENAKAWALEALGDVVFSSQGRTMEAEVGFMLKKNRLTLAVAESCTGGLISHLLTNIPGSSEYFLLSAVTYANAAKQNLLGVSRQILEQYGAVHEETVKLMAQGIQKISGADIGLSVSGIAGPTGAAKDKPVGTVCVGVSRKDKTTAARFQSPFQERLSNKQIFAICALNMLRQELKTMELKG